MQNEITTLKGVEMFMEQVATELEDFHPLEDFADYTRPNSHVRRYTEDEAAERNRSLEQCFIVCAKFTDDYFAYLLNLYRLERAEITRMRKKPKEMALKALLSFI